MHDKGAAMTEKTWGEHLSYYQQPNFQLFDEHFLARWGDLAWNPGEADKRAASLLHTQISSRITTRPLAYLEGIEAAALDSVFHTNSISQ
jgi:hypothetical protein